MNGLSNNLIALESPTEEVEARIGDQFFYVINRANTEQVTAPAVELRQLLERCDLARFAPTPTKAHDAFRRATKALEARIKINWQHKDLNAQLYVRELRSDAEHIIRGLVREVIDQDQAKAFYDTVAYMIFDRSSHTFDVHLDSEFSDEAGYAEMIEEGRKQYLTLIGQINETRIRIMLSEMLGRLHPTSLKRGVYFIPNYESYIDTLDRIQEFVQGLGSILQGGTIRSQRLFIYDRDKMEIEKNMREQTIAHIERLKAQLREVRNNPSEDLANRVAAILLEATEARRKIEVYEQALNLTMENLRSRVESLREEAYQHLG